MTIIQEFHLKRELFDKFFAIMIAYLQNISIFAIKTNTKQS